MMVAFGLFALFLCFQKPDINDFQSFSFSSIQIPVWVTDSYNVPVSGLGKDRFELAIDGKDVTIDGFLETYDQPIEMVYLLDISGSMGIGGKLEGSLEALQLMMSRHQPEDRWKVVIFSDGQILEIYNQKVSQPWSQISPKIKAYGKTALFDALGIIDTYYSEDSLPNRAAVVFTDGSDNMSLLDEPRLLALLRVINIPLFIVGIGDGYNMSEEDRKGATTLRSIAEITGGAYHLAKSAYFLPAIANNLEQTMRPSYLLTISVENKQSTVRHRIDVRLDDSKKHSLRHRTGYVGSLPYGGN